MNSIEGIIAANKAADKAFARKHNNGVQRTKAGEVAAGKFHAKQIRQDKSGRLIPG